MSKIQLLLGFGALRPDAAFDALAAQPVVPLSSPAGTLSRPSRRSHLSLGFKRLVDIVVSALAILALPLVFLLVALAILVCDGGPVVYRHKRIGRNGRSFHCYKFRTMARDADARLQRLLAVDPAARKEWEDRRKLKKDPRVHRIGDFLRRSSLDELPQLFNILSGDMSLVGPRPIVAEEIVRFGPHFTDYKSVRPGLTGLWQISGRSDTTYEQRVALDQYYAAHGSTAIDLRILMNTPAIVLRRDGSC